MAGKRTLSWMFRLFDRMSPSAKAISRSLGDVEKKLRRTNDATKKHEHGLHRAAAATRRLGDAHRHAGQHGAGFFMKLTGWYMSMQMGIAMVKGLASAVFTLPLAFAKAGIAAASFKESTMLGLNMMLRDKKTAAALYGEAVNFADVSPFETQETLQWYRQLVPGVGTKGLGTPGGSRILKVLAGLGDIASSQPNPSDAMGHIILQITQMLSKGRALGQDLRPLAEAGVNLGQVYDIIAKKKGISRAEIMSTKWEGKIGAGEMLEAILQFSANQYGGGVLGGGMAPASRTFQGLMSTLASRPYRLMEDLGNTGGFKSLKSALANLVDVLDPSTPRGARIKKNIEEMFDRMLGGVFKRFEDPKAVEDWVNSLLNGFERLIPKVEKFATTVGDLVQNLSKVGEFLDVFLFKGPISTMLDEWGKGTGAPVTMGRTGALVKRLHELDAKGKLNGFERQELENVQLQLRGLGIDVPPPTGKPAASKPTSMHFQRGSVHIEINGAQDPKAVGDELEDRLASVFERLAMQQGA